MALHNSLRRCELEESIFWARELILSEEENELYLTMIQAWLVWLGAPGVSWLDRWVKIEKDVGGCERMSLVAEFVKMRRELKVRRAPHSFQCFIMVARGFAEEQRLDIVGDALNANNFFELYKWLGPEYSSSPLAIIDTLCSYVEESPELFDGYKTCIKSLKGHIKLKHLLAATAVQTLCLSEWPTELELTQQSVVAKLLAQWEPVTGRRKSRLFTIKTEMLPRCYKRIAESEMLYGSAVELMDNGCQFWKSVRKIIVDDESLEEVVRLYFPDNIPDEWSREDRSASHPDKSETYKVHMKNSYRAKLAWALKFDPAIYKSWGTKFKQLLTDAGVPDW